MGNFSNPPPACRATSSPRRRESVYLAFAILSILFAGFVWVQANHQQATFSDLSVIGHGQPVVVLVSAGSCSVCGEVEQRTRSALSDLHDVQFRIADVCTREGEKFSHTYESDPISVLLFDKDGENTASVHGVQSEQTMHDFFQKQFELSLLRGASIS
jgi:hypothetical protein